MQGKVGWKKKGFTSRAISASYHKNSKIKLGRGSDWKLYRAKMANYYNYYKTVRGPDFKFDHWKEDLNPIAHKSLQSDPTCLRALKTFDYSIIDV